MADVVMPRLSDSMEEGTILQWLKKLGDDVAVGDELVEIETDKANMAYESDVGGTLSEILVQEGETVAIGTPIARVGGDSEAPSRDGEGSAATSAGPVAAGDPPPPAVAKASSGAGPPTAPPADVAINGPTSANGDSERPKASPVARRIAK
ncbi:MAG TPA: biotin/lipoyl-containing protein, partial [Solirubrobacterales bacterium]|nr:biotin/lipoyl-containing protein [Solirubrobacterales bacterium]